jgi:hypothetical protein
MSKNKDTMTDERWKYLKQLRQSAGAFIHVSKTFFQADHPFIPGLKYWKPNKGQVYNVGSNARKRATALRKLRPL